ncbi:MAG TPA: hypothetical protein VMV73_05615 [Candidatus Dormibacteraeota bacterium]|nr:hypothetical protein [Candidatus Dormibacteraeota bacterium]
MTVALVIAFVVIRTRNAYSRRRQTLLTDRWRSIFKTAYTGEDPPEVFPAIGKRDWFTVVSLFLQFHQLRDKDRDRAQEVHPKLDDIARKIDLDERALLWLHRGDDAEKIIAFKALGELREPAALDDAVKMSSDEGAELSRAAAHCALRIDVRFTDGVLELVRDRDDWVRSRVEQMLKEIAQIDLDEGMRAATENADEAGRRRLLDFMRFCSPSPARSICKRVLNDSSETETIAAALRSLAPLASEEDRPLALRYCAHDDPIVLLSALRVLRKCVRYDDRELLVRLASHRDYWVRLRAAEAIVELYGESGLIDEFIVELKDRYARDAIAQAITDRQMMARRKAPRDRRGSTTSSPEPADVTAPAAAPTPQMRVAAVPEVRAAPISEVAVVPIPQEATVQIIEVPLEPIIEMGEAPSLEEAPVALRERTTGMHEYLRSFAVVFGAGLLLYLVATKLVHRKPPHDDDHRSSENSEEQA